MNNQEIIKAANKATQAIVADMAITLKPHVNRIESSNKTAHSHLDQYLSLMSQFPDKEMKKVMAQALIKAGGNAKRIATALNLS